MTETLIIGASTAAVGRLLEETLTEQQRESVSVAPQILEDPFEPTQRGEGATLQSVVMFTAEALAAGVVYDLVKAAAIRAYGALNVKPVEGDASSGPDPEA